MILDLLLASCLLIFFLQSSFGQAYASNTRATIYLVVGFYLQVAGLYDRYVWYSDVRCLIFIISYGSLCTICFASYHYLLKFHSFIAEQILDPYLA